MANSDEGGVFFPPSFGPQGGGKEREEEGDNMNLYGGLLGHAAGTDIRLQGHFQWERWMTEDPKNNKLIT